MKIFRTYFQSLLVLGILVLGVSCHSEDSVTNHLPDPISAERGSEVLSIFEEIDLIALTLVQQEVVNVRQIQPTLSHYGAKRIP
ncbi:hypothetical protein ADIS_2719 [Lunatimonas lonarensis]|uniref:Uncharacterized protein n=1 Tax=Lunatimonas lonarensis TaxID=1232681 RepID=R7ZS25_9BACT|nr:hypothetical protein [Lunatimonas lonarensis]EON76848.1 hypothetical protein ADIS_2719 [Lunatimonas lonarensis]